MSVSIGYTCISMILLFICVQPALNYKFKQFPTYNDLNQWAVFSNARSSIHCGTLCTQRRRDNGVQPICEAYRYSTLDRRCQLYVAHSGGTDAFGVSVHKYYAVDEDPLDGFDYVTNGGQTYIYYVSTAYMSFENARSHCQNLGGYLLNLDSSAEVDVLAAFVTSKGIVRGQLWVGAHDIADEGVWVTDRDGLLADNNTWIFGAGEPNGGNHENCATANAANNMVLFDQDCSRPRQAICERTP